MLILFDPNHERFYMKVVNSAIFDKHVDYVYQSNHQIVQILYIKDSKFVNCNSFFDFYQKTKDEPYDTKKNKLINGAIRLLNKFKD